MVPTVLGDDVVEHFHTSIVLEVHVDIRHLLALYVQEALEDDVVYERVDVCNAQGIEDKAAGRTAPHGEGNVVFTDKPGDVPYHQEVVVVASLPDDV